MFDNQLFGERLRSLRKAKGVSQQVIADLLEIKPPRVSEMENGKTTTSFARLVLLADYFDVSTDYLLGLSLIHIYSR